MNEIMKTEQHDIITADKISEYMKVFGIDDGLNDNEKKQFIEVATAYQLNPFKREIYCTPYMTNVKQEDGTWKKVRKLSIITGYETYLKRAERSGALNGWSVEISGNGDNRTAKIIVHRKDWQHPFTHEVILSEYKEDNKMWKEKPMTMLKKVAMAQGFRLAFPDELGGMPYVAEELPDNMTAEPHKIESPEPEKKNTPKVDVTPDALKNDKGEIEIPKGKHDEAMKFLSKVQTETMLDAFLNNRDKRVWTTEELKEQDGVIEVLRAQWKAELDAVNNKG